MNKIMALATLVNAFTFNQSNIARESILSYLEYDLDEVSNVDPRLVLNNYESAQDIKFEYRIDDNTWEEYSNDKEFEGEKIQFRVLEKQLSSTVNITNYKCSFTNGDSFLIGENVPFTIIDMDLKISYTSKVVFDENRCSSELNGAFSLLYVDNAADEITSEYKCDTKIGKICSVYKRDIDGEPVYIYPNRTNSIIHFRFIYFDGLLSKLGDVSQSFNIYNFKEVYISKWLKIDKRDAISFEYNLDKNLNRDQLLENICDSEKCLDFNKEIFMSNLSFESNGNTTILRTKMDNLKDIVISFKMPENDAITGVLPQQQMESHLDGQIIAICSISLLLVTFILIYMYKRWNK